MSTLNTYQASMFTAIRSFLDRYGEAFPSIPTLAQMAGMCQRKAVDVIKELVEMGLIRKTPRFETKEGRCRQLSNQYEIVEQPAPEERVEETPKPSRAPYIKAFKNLLNKSLNLDDDHYDYRVEWYFDIAREYVSKETAKTILQEIRPQLKSTSWVALRVAFSRLKENAARISHFGKWFQTALFNANIAVQLGAN